MASSLTGISIASSYDALLKVGDNDGLSASLQVISDGLGTYWRAPKTKEKKSASFLQK